VPLGKLGVGILLRH